MRASKRSIEERKNPATIFVARKTLQIDVVGARHQPQLLRLSRGRIHGERLPRRRVAIAFAADQQQRRIDLRDVRDGTKLVRAQPDIQCHPAQQNGRQRMTERPQIPPQDPPSVSDEELSAYIDVELNSVRTADITALAQYDRVLAGRIAAFRDDTI